MTKFHQRGLARADRFDLGAVEDDAGREVLEEFVLEPRLLVADLHRALFLVFRHILAKVVIITFLQKYFAGWELFNIFVVSK